MGHPTVSASNRKPTLDINEWINNKESKNRATEETGKIAKQSFNENTRSPKATISKKESAESSRPSKRSSSKESTPKKDVDSAATPKVSESSPSLATPAKVLAEAVIDQYPHLEEQKVKNAELSPGELEITISEKPTTDEIEQLIKIYKSTIESVNSLMDKVNVLRNECQHSKDSLAKVNLVPPGNIPKEKKIDYETQQKSPHIARYNQQLALYKEYVSSINQLLPTFKQAIKHFTQITTNAEAVNTVRIIDSENAHNQSQALQRQMDIFTNQKAYPKVNQDILESLKKNMDTTLAEADQSNSDFLKSLSQAKTHLSSLEANLEKLRDRIITDLPSHLDNIAVTLGLPIEVKPKSNLATGWSHMLKKFYPF